MMGHSLGGYTSAAILGGWTTWKDSRFKSALLLSPYLNAFQPGFNAAHLIEDSGIENPLGIIAAPVMFQTGTMDIGILPFLKAIPGGTYALTNGGGKGPTAAAGTYFVNFVGPNHFTWSNAVCLAYGSIQNCLAESPEAAGLLDASLLFLEQHLKGVPQPRLTQPNMGLEGDGLADYWWKSGYTSPNAPSGVLGFTR